jgi:hypothetical protein
MEEKGCCKHVSAFQKGFLQGLGTRVPLSRRWGLWQLKTKVRIFGKLLSIKHW